MSKSDRKFLGPISALVASLLTSTLQNGAKADAALQHATEKALEVNDMESIEGRPSPEPLTIEVAYQGMVTLDHYSHSSHSSHSSHMSGFTP
jgi:hypothetical protein